MHFKLCSIKFNYVIVSWFIAVYYLLLAVYLAHHSFTDVHKLPKHYAGRFQATFDYAARLVIELVGTACLAWGIAFRDINCLLVWLGVAISFVIRNITSKILYLLYGGVLINTTDMWIHCVIIGEIKLLYYNYTKTNSFLQFWTFCQRSLSFHISSL